MPPCSDSVRTGRLWYWESCPAEFPRRFLQPVNHEGTESWVNRHPGDPGSNSSRHTLSGRRPGQLRSTPELQETLESTRARSSQRSHDREPSPACSKTELRVPPRSTTQSNSWEWAIAPANSLTRVGQQAQTRLGQDLDTRYPVKNKPLEESLKPQHNDTD